MSGFEAAITVAVIALATMITRFSPFVIFPDAKKAPPFVKYLGGVLPHAMMGMLVVYCLKDVDFAAAPHGLPELLSVLAAALLHLYKRNVIVSIAGSTALYMVLIRVL